MSIYELKILFDLNPESKSKVLDKYANKCKFVGYFFVDSEDGHCYLFDRNGEEKDISLVHEINKYIIPIDIKKIVIPDNVTRIEYEAFYSCSDLESVTIPYSVSSIGNYAFYSCGGLTSVTIPDSVTSIGPDVFYGCSSLKSLIFKNKTMKQVKSMKYYPFGIKDESIIEAELN